MDHSFPLPPNEAARIAELMTCRILERPNLKSLSLLTEVAATAFGVPVALVSLIDAETQWMKAIHGGDVTQMPRSTSFCTYAIMQDEPMVVLDAKLDERFMDNPLVTGQPLIRFYAGTSLLSAGGHALGSFCVIDHLPHEQFSAREQRMLRKFAATSAEIILDDMRRLSQPARTL